MAHLPAQLGQVARELRFELDEVPSVKPQATQNATQSPSVLRRSSWIQFRFGRSRAPSPELVDTSGPASRPTALQRGNGIWSEPRG